jgi:hypothetical protein
MGMFDTVLVKCPKCGEENAFQSKSGECVMEYYALENCPDNVLFNVNRHSPYQCDCGTLYEVDIPARKAIISKPKTKKEVETEIWVDEYILKFRCPPTYREIEQQFNIDSSAAHFRCRNFRHKMRTNNQTTMQNEQLKGNESILAKVEPKKAGEIIHEAFEVYLETGKTPKELAIMLVFEPSEDVTKYNANDINLTQTDSGCFLSYLKHYPTGDTESIPVDPNDLTKEQLIAILTRKKS